MHTFTTQRKDTDSRNWQPFFDFLDSLGFERREFPDEIVGSVDIHFEGYETPDDAIVDPLFREAVQNRLGPELPFCVVCTLETDAYRLLTLARMIELGVVRTTDTVTYRPRDIEVRACADREELAWQRWGSELGIDEALIARRSAGIRDYFLAMLKPATS